MKLYFIYLAIGIVILIIVAMVIVLATSVERYATYWKNKTKEQKLDNSIVYVAMGDSAAQGIGASSPEGGYVGLIAKRLEKQYSRPVRVINISKSGAKIEDVIANELPQIKGSKPDVITLEIGANDIQSFNKELFEKQTQELFANLPKNSIVSDIPFFGGRSRFSNTTQNNVETANSILHSVASKNKFELVQLYIATKEHNNYPWSYAIDYFHPNNLGYQTWANVFYSKINL